MFRKTTWLAWGVVASLSTFAACGDKDETFSCRDSGPARCLGKFANKEGVAETDGSLTYEFTLDEGPACVSGAVFRAFYRPPVSTSSDTVLFYLPSDGAWLPTADPMLTSGRRTPATLALANAHPSFQEDHPLIGDHHLVYVAACDGSLYSGDRDYTSEELAELGTRESQRDPRYYRGAMNVTAGLDIALQHQPAPKRVIVSGSGAGSMGGITAIFAAAAAYPNAEEYVLLQDGTTGIVYGELNIPFITGLLDLWGVRPYLPQDCTGCDQNGHLTLYLRHALQTMPNLRVGSFQSTQETAMPMFVNGVPNGIPLELDHWRCEILKEMSALSNEFPDRYGAFITDRRDVTFATLPEGDQYQIDGVTFESWLSRILDPSQEPITLSESSLTELEGCDP